MCLLLILNDMRSGFQSLDQLDEDGEKSYHPRPDGTLFRILSGCFF